MYNGYYYGFDMTYLVLVVPALLIALIAQIQVKSAFSRYARVRCTSGLTGAQAAQRILQANGITDVRIEHISGKLTDHFDPQAKVIRLSDEVYGVASIAAVGVAAQFHMDGVIAQAQALVDLVEPRFQRPGHAADDVRAGVVQAVAHVFGRGEVVLEDVADDGLAAAVEIDVHGIFRALDDRIQNRLQLVAQEHGDDGRRGLVAAQPVVVAGGGHATAGRSRCCRRPG